MLVRVLNGAEGDWLCSGRRKAIWPSAPIRVVSSVSCRNLTSISPDHGILFLDLSKVFDKVVRETLFGMRNGEINIETHLLGLGLSQAAAKHMAACIDKSGGLLREIGVPDVIAELV